MIKVLRFSLISLITVLLTPLLGWSSNPALDEVNALRVKKGLPPYVLDKRLQEGAERCADYRAEYRIKGHTSNDFKFLPVGSGARAAGCAAWKSEWGWGSCCTFERQWKYAGAAWTLGKDNLRYMELFVK